MEKKRNNGFNLKKELKHFETTIAEAEAFREKHFGKTWWDQFSELEIEELGRQRCNLESIGEWMFHHIPKPNRVEFAPYREPFLKRMHVWFEWDGSLGGYDN
jgi:hypothetical protein